MRQNPRRAAYLVWLILSAALLANAPGVFSSSDGNAGGTPQVPERLRECAEGFEYCTFSPSGCGGCHGNDNDMRVGGSEDYPWTPVIDRIGAKVVVSGNPSFWEYTPDRTYLVDVDIVFKNGFDNPASRPNEARPSGYGDYSSGAFGLNASGGQFSILPGDDTVRLAENGNYTHYGTHNETVNQQWLAAGATDRYGSFTDNESQYAGEALSTYAGSLQRSWSLQWRSPPAGAPHGVALMATVMVPNGNGLHADCVHVECNSTLGYSDPVGWDWWTWILHDTESPSIPRAIILCEEGYFDSRAECQDAVLDEVLPPTPPPDTGENGEGDGDGGGPGSPGVPGWAIVALVAALALAERRRRDKA